MSADSSTRLLQLDPLLEAKNPNVRNEAAAAFGKFSIYDEKVANIIKKHLCSQSWETRVSAGRALQAILSNFDDFEGCGDEIAESVNFERLKSINVLHVLKNYAPLLSDSESSLAKLEKQRGNRESQREQVDKHLELSQITGLSSKKFLSDNEFLNESTSNAPISEQSAQLQDSEIFEKIKFEQKDQESDLLERRRKFWSILYTFIEKISEKQWFARHGAAIAICQIASTTFSRLPNELVDATLVQLLHVLILDKFNDFISGRNATAPVREQCAQALVHILRNTDDARRTVLLEVVVQMVGTKGDDNWNVRQSGLLILKYYFAIAEKNVFSKCFELVIQSLQDNIDDVTGCAVKTLSSILSNRSEMSDLVDTVMSHIWKLLELESGKEQLRAGLDALCIDLLEIVQLWMTWHPANSISRASLLVICSMLDASFPVRSEKIVQILDVDMEREQGKLSGQDVLGIVKQLYRILLFTPPAESLTFLEKVFVTFTKVWKIYQKSLIEQGELSRKVGNWLSCLLLDHRNPQIDVFACDIVGIASNSTSPTELMCSEEMRFLGEKEKDNVYLTRKILCAKFLATIFEALYESNEEIQGQRVDIAVQLLFSPIFQSTSIMHNLGASIVVNEWAALYRASINSKSTDKPPPFHIVQMADQIVRGPGKQYDEMTSIVHGLTKECNDFIDFCVVRGFNRKEAEERGDAVEEVSKLAYSTVRPGLKTEKQREAIDSRYNTLMRSIEYAKMNIKSNAIRITALLSSTLFYFGSAPEKLTPQIRPIVETMQTEENDAVASEVFRGAVPLLVMYSWQRTPRPSNKVMMRALDSFSGCSFRMPKISESSESSDRIITLERLDEEVVSTYSSESRNAELFLTILCQFSASQLPEFYSKFDLAENVQLTEFLIRLELHNSLWMRVGSRLSEQSVAKIFELIPSGDPAIRFAFSKSIETFCKSYCGDTLSKVYQKLVELSHDLENVQARLTAVEVFLRLSMLDANYLNGWATLLAPPLFSLLTDPCEAVRDAAGEAFRRLVPVVTLENVDVEIEALSPELCALRQGYKNFINVLGSPSSLPRVERHELLGGLDASILREYQLEGITWMRFLRAYGMHGILADDMGLGKTLQTMCTIALSIDKDENKAQERCSLIVCPRTLVDHWCLEWSRFFPLRPKASKYPKRCQGSEICVVAYEDLKNVVTVNRVWNYVVLDEGHVIRNAKCRAWKMTIQLRCKSRLILSGTPVQNSPADLWSLFAWLMPGYLGTDKQFRAQFLKKILKCRLPKANELELKAGSAAISHLHKLILPFVMRRLKTEVLRELPDKNVQDYECQLSEEQKEIYRFLVDRCSSSATELQNKSGISSLVCLMALRKLTDHPVLVLETLKRIGASEALLQKALTAKSGKMEALKQLLIACEICENPDDDEPPGEELGAALQEPAGHRALIFCQWKTSAKLVSHKLSSGEFGSVVPHLVLDGDVPPESRMQMVHRFNEDKAIDVLVLTTHIGGVGLNLTGADTVIFLDHDWNPMKDLQAIDRAHRLGQTRNVNVYRLITQGTVEEKVMSLAKFKLNTANALIGADNTSMMTMETNELMNMFTLDGDEKATSSEGVPAKRAKAEKGEEVNLAMMWDESQYDDFQIDSFLKT